MGAERHLAGPGADGARHRAVRLTVAVASAALILITAGCGASAGTPRPASRSTRPPPASSASPASAPSPPLGRVSATVPPASVSLAPSSPPAASPRPTFQASTSALTAAMRDRMTGVSWQAGCPVPLSQLRLVRVSYWGFDDAVHQGELVANASAAASVTQAFRQLFTARFPIRQMRVVDDFGGDDERSMRANNTSAFNCRLVPGTTTWAQHAYGLAVDINPLQNPEIRNGNADPPAAAAWADRSRTSPAMIKEGNAAWRAFRAIGWTWGGDWRTLKDYMHFSANGM